MKEKLFLDNIFWKKLFQLAAPIALQNLMLASVAAADALMLGRVTQNSMSAVSLATQIQFIQNMVLMAIVSTIVILGAQYWGKKDITTVNDIFCIGLRLSVATSLIFFIGCTCFPGYLMMIFTNEEALITIGIRYLKVAGWSYLLTGISQCYLAIMLAVTPFVTGFVKMTDQASHYLIGMMIIMAFYMIGRTVNTIIINGIFAAGGDTLFDMYSLAVCMWGIAVPLAAAGTFLFNWPVLVVYACTCLDEVGKIPWVMYHYRKYKWVRDLTR